RFRILKNLGKGSFGVVYKCEDIITKKKYALKLEQRRKILNNRELIILDRLKSCDRVSTLLWHGNFKLYKVMILKLQGPNLSTIFELNNKEFGLKSCIHIAIEILRCIESIHLYGIVHRDIKPQNFVIGLKDPTK